MQKNRETGKEVKLESFYYNEGMIFLFKTNLTLKTTQGKHKQEFENELVFM